MSVPVTMKCCTAPDSSRRAVNDPLMRRGSPSAGVHRISRSARSVVPSARASSRLVTASRSSGATSRSRRSVPSASAAS
jgi:hypothetical protein